MTAAEHLAHFVTHLDITAIPQAARDYAKLCLLNTLSIALAGYAEPSTRAARSVAQQHGGTPQGTLALHLAQAISTPRSVQQQLKVSLDPSTNRLIGTCQNGSRDHLHASNLAPIPNSPYTESKAIGGADAQCQCNMTVSGRVPGVPAHSLNRRRRVKCASLASIRPHPEKKAGRFLSSDLERAAAFTNRASTERRGPYWRREAS